MDTRTKLPALPFPAAATNRTTPGSVGLFQSMDHAKEAAIARFTGGVSPAALALAFFDWLVHLSVAPGKQLELAQLGAGNTAAIGDYLVKRFFHLDVPVLVEPLSEDHRFSDSGWNTDPYRLWQQAFLLTEQWWSAATHEVPGATRHHENVVAFVSRQLLDIAAPTNSLFTNPEVVRRTTATLGANLFEGARNLLADVRQQAGGIALEGGQTFRVGIDLASTPGKVVFANHLIELIQYSPATGQVHAEPILIVPAWIMKYYILDLSPHNSLIRFLVGEGHTVFCISWRNVDSADRDVSLDDYRRLGVMAALDAVTATVPGQRVHAAGYCLGGTLLSIAAADMAGAGDERFASVTLLAAQTDFTEPGELQLFIDESEVYFIESMMSAKGYLDASQMSGAFQLLQSNDLIWSHVIRDYLLGEREPMFDLMAWDADATRMPYRMHSEYLRQLFLHNDLAASRYPVDGRPISMRNIRAPLFVVGTENDHIAPWHSVYKIHYLTNADMTFVLTSGGHNAGIVSEPGHANRHYRIEHAAATDMRIGPEEWVGAAQPQAGSWWVAWTAWLNEHGTPGLVAPPALGTGGHADLPDAPGTYVLQH